MDPLTFSIIYKKNLANPLRNASTTAYCTGDPWCTRDQSNTVVEILMLGTIKIFVMWCTTLTASGEAPSMI